jgi:hypothetical protein
MRMIYNLATEDTEATEFLRLKKRMNSSPKGRGTAIF